MIPIDKTAHALALLTISAITFASRLRYLYKICIESRSQRLGSEGHLLFPQVPALLTKNEEDVQTLEEAILQDLAIRRADAILDQGSGNSLCYRSVDTGEERVLASIG